MLPLIIALQIVAPAGSLGAPLRPADSAAIVWQMHEETAEFLWVWRFYWQASEGLRHEIQGDVFPYDHLIRTQSLSNRVVRDRVNHVHCHPDSRGGFPLLPTIIREGGASLRAICPRWALPDAPPFDERLSIDDAIAESLRSGTRLKRAELIASLERASAAVPGDMWVVGQRTRFAVDQGDTDAIERAIRECRAADWWCAALSGYARYATGDAAAADSLFAIALAAMSPSERCAWDDVSALLDDAAQKQYQKMSCSQRDSVNARVWWLADPLYTEPGNERRAEHYARLVMIAVRRESSSRDRWNWMDGEGGRSLKQMLVRYGWPSFAWWSGPREDRSHYSYLGVLEERVREAGTFTTAEYTTPRYHTVPAWSAIVDPWHAPASAWTIAAPRDDDGKPDASWWPQEHYGRRAGPMAPIDEQQTALLRRGNEVELAIAADLSRVRLARGLARSAIVALAVTPSPEQLRVERKNAPVDSVVVARTMIPATPTIVGLEVRTTGTVSFAGRTRFGVTPPPPLSVMGRGEIAISDPVLVRPPAGDDRPISNPDRVLGEMLGTTRLRKLSRMGVYWETYGISAGDSVDVSVRIERLGTPSLFRRLGTALHVADRVDGGATIGWKEPQSTAAATTTINGPVPIQGRNVSIDLSRLAPDRYSVTVSVARDGVIVSSTREFEILR